MKGTQKLKHQPYKALKLFLAGRGVTYEEVGKVIGTTASTVQQKINGGSDFYISEQRAICKAFGIESTIFFTDIVA